MDRYKHFVKLEQIKELIRKGDKEEAVKLAQTLEFKRIKNNSDLYVLSDLFLDEDMPVKSQECLMIIYSRTKTRSLLMQLINLSVHLKKAGEAESFYREFNKMAPDDFYNYIFRYRIDKLENKSYDILIESLEQLKKTEYIEEWAYELAKLYHKSGQEQKCIEECDNIAIWFGDGVYVDKARALKSYYLGELDLANMKKETYQRAAEAEQREADWVGAEQAEAELTGAEQAETELVAVESAEVEQIEAEPVEAEQTENEPVGAKQVEQVRVDTYYRDPETVQAEEEAFNVAKQEPAMDEEDARINEILEEEQNLLAAMISSELEAEAAEAVNAKAEVVNASAEAITEVATEDTGVETADDDIDLAELLAAADEAEEQTEEPFKARMEELLSEASQKDEGPLAEQELQRADIERMDEALRRLEEEEQGRTEELNIGRRAETSGAEISETETAGAGMTDKATDLDDATGGAADDEAAEAADDFDLKLRCDRYPIKEDSRLAAFLKDQGNQLEDYFGYYAVQPEIRSQLIKSLDILLNPQIKNICLAVTGGKHSGKSGVTKGIAKILYQGGQLKELSCALTEAARLNGIKIEERLDKLIGKCFVIERAGQMTKETAADLLACNATLEGKTAVVLSDSRSELNKLFKNYRDLNSMFPVRIHIPEFDKEDLVEMAYYEIRKQDYAISAKAREKLEGQIAIIAKINKEGAMSQVAKLVNETIDSVDTRAAKSFIEQTLAGAERHERNNLILEADVPIRQTQD